MDKTPKSSELQGIPSSKQNEEELKYLEDQIDQYSTTPPRQGDTRGYYDKLRAACFLKKLLEKQRSELN